MKFVPLSEVNNEAKTDEGSQAEGLTFVPLEKPAPKAESKAEPKARPKAKVASDDEYDFGSAMGTGAEEIMAAARKKQSVLEGQQMPAPLPTEDKYVVRPEFVDAVKAQLDAVPPEQRQAALAKLVERGDVYGRAARAIAGRYAEADKVVSKQLRYRTDPRLEVQTERFMGQSMRPEIAEGQAKLQALRGQVRPDFQQVGPDVVGEIAAEEAGKRASELEDAGFWRRVGAGVTSEYTKAGLGLLSAYADLTGDDQFSRDLVSARRVEDARGKAIPEGKSIFDRSAQGAMTSLGTQVPFLALSVVTGTAAPVLAQAAIQQFGDAYSEGRAAGLSGEAATARAVSLASAEVVFERFGMTKALAGLKGYIAKNGVRGIPEYMAKAVVSEIPPEMATTLTQYGIDIVPGIGLNKNPSVVGLYKQMEETLRQTILQAGATAGGTIAAAKGAQYGAEALKPMVSPETRQRLEAFTGPREGGYQKDESYEGISQLIAQSKGFLTPQRRQQRQEQEDFGELGSTRPGDERQFTFTPLDEFELPNVPTAQEREREVNRRAAEIEATGIPADDALELAEAEVVEQEKKNAAQAKRLATQVPEDRVTAIAQDLIAAGEDPQRAINMAFQQAREEAEADALFKEQEKEAKLAAKRAKEEKKNAGQPISKTSRKGAGVAGQPGTKPAPGGVAGVDTSGVVSTGQDVTGATTGEAAQPVAVTDEEAYTERTKDDPTAPAYNDTDGRINRVADRYDQAGDTGLAMMVRNIPNKRRPTYEETARLEAEQDQTLKERAEQAPAVVEPTLEQDIATQKKLLGALNRAKKKLLQDENLASGDPKIDAAKAAVEKAQKDYDAFVAESEPRRTKRIEQLTTGADVGTQTSETKQAAQKGQKKPRASRATGKPRGRPAVLTEEERKEKLEGKKPVQAEKKRADDAITRIYKSLTKLAQPMDESIYANDDEVAEAEQKRRDEKRELIKELFKLQQSPNLRGTAVNARIKEALNHPSITAKEKADIQAGMAAAKTTGPSSAVTIAKGPADSAFGKFTTGAQALSHIIKTGNLFQQKLGKRLRGFVNGVKFVVIEKGDALPDQLKKAKNAEQWERSIALYIENYKTGDKVIYVRGASFGVDQGVNNTTIMHELLHAATNRKLALAYAMIQKGLNTDSAIVRAAQDLIRTMNSAGTLFNELSANGTLTKEMSVLASHGEIFDDPREFVAYGMTDPAMQKFLLQAHGYEEDVPFFNRFVSGIRDLFGMSDDDTNAMTDLIIVTDKLLSARTPAWAKLSGEVVSTSTDAFKNWFGKSKVVDKDGKPLILYHGTTNDITIFRMSPDGALGAGIYLTPEAEYANQYAPKNLAGANVIPVYASIKNPLIIDGSIRDPMIEALVRLGVHESKATSIVEKAYEEKGYIGKQVMTRAMAQGYDGIMQYSRDGELSEVVVFSNTQVKSVFNQGTYLIGSGNISQTILPEESASSTAYVPQKKVRAAPSANTQRLSKMLGNKLYGTPDDIAKVSVKELFQNAFDAIKEALEKGQLTKGKISVAVNEKDRTIKIVDNGPGMPTSVMGGQFLQIAGTVKGTARASGGLGVAKMLFLFENKELEVVSLRDGVVSRLSTTGDELKAAMAANPNTLLEQLRPFLTDEDIEIIIPLIEASVQRMRDRGEQVPEISIEVSTDQDAIDYYTDKYFPDGHGTAVIIEIPKNYIDESTGDEKVIRFDGFDLENSPVLIDSPLFTDIDVTFHDTTYVTRSYGDKPKTLPIGATFPIDEYTPFANVRFAWGVARIYVSKEKKDKRNHLRGNTHVLSNGLWQFDTDIKDKPGWEGRPIKRNFYIDVSPNANVKPEDAGYPFELNRQSFSKVAEADFKKIFAYITAIYSQLDLASGVKNFGDVQYVNPDGTLSPKETLEPKTPISDNAFTLIKPGDKVEVKDGVLYVNNRAVPELTNDDLKKVAIKIDELTIPQNELDSNRIMVHDNTVARTGGKVEPAIDSDRIHYDRTGKQDSYGFDTYKVVVAPEGEAGYNTQNPEHVIEGTPEEIEAKLLKLGVYKETDVQSLSDLARDKYGIAYDKYLAGIGQTFMYLRDALVAGGRGEYGGLSEQVIGTSIDNEYYGVNIMIPFKGMFINPSVTKFSDTPQEIALSMIGTMIHELAHFKVRSHDSDFPAEMQKIMVLLEVYPNIDMRQVQQALTYHIQKNIDIFKFLEKEFKSGNLKPRGNRFKDASAEEISDESAPRPVGGASQTREGRSSLSAITGEGTKDTGELVDDDGDDSETEAVRGSIRSQKEVDKKVAEVGEQFNESVKGDKFAEGVSLLQMMQDPREVIPALRALWNRATYFQRNALVRIPTTDFLVQWASNAVPELANTNRLLQQMNGMTLQFLKSSGELVDSIDRAFRADKTLRVKLDKIAFESTLAEVDPSNPSADERSVELDKQYADLGVDGQRLFVQIKQHFERLSAYFTKLLDDQITKSNMSIAQQANLMKKIRMIYEQGGKISPYFPLVREGDYWLAIGKGKTRKFFMFESMKERDNAMQAFADERVKQKPGESWGAFQKRRAANLEELLTDKEFVYDNDISSLRRISSDSSALLREIFDVIDSSNLGDSDSKDKLKDAVYQVYLQTMPDQSFRKQFIHRKGVTGFRPDLMRNVAHTTTKMATQLARIKYAPLLRNSLSGARGSIENRPRYTPFVNEMERRVKDELAYEKDSTGEQIAGALNKASFIWYLGGASSALLQPLSLFQTGMPVLWKYGSVNASREMGRMIKMWGQFGVYKDNPDGTKSWVAPSVEHAKGMTPDERRAIRDMLSRDVTTSTYASSIFEYKSTPTDKRSGPIVSFGKETVDVLVLGGLMHSTERISREMLFLSSYRLNRDMMAKGSMNPAQAHQAAVDQAVMDTNEALGNYGQYNRPLFMKNAVGKVLTQFMMYPVHVTLFLLRNFMEIIKPMGGRTRAEAIKKFFGTLGTTFVLAGAVGIPMFSTIMGVIGSAWEKMRGDEDWPKELKDLSFELWFRTVWLEEQLGGTRIGGKKLSEVVERGLANALTGLDISGRTSLNNMWFRDTKESKNIREGAMALALEKAGPSANMILSWLEAYEAFTQGDFDKGVNRALPAGFRNFKTSYDLFKEGAKDNKGVQILSRDAFSTGQLIFQAVGFRSDLLANTQYVTFKVIGLEQKILNERTQILNQLDREFREKDFKGFNETLSKRVNKFNREYPSYELEADDVTGSIYTRAEQRAESYRGVKLTEKNVPVFIKALRPSREAAREAEEKGREKQKNPR
jgi:hypothetical protein